VDSRAVGDAETHTQQADDADPIAQAVIDPNVQNAADLEVDEALESNDHEAENGKPEERTSPFSAPPRPSAMSAPPREISSREHTPREVAPVFGGLGGREHREAADFGRCLTNNLRHLRKYPARGIFCFRIYERDVTDVPLIVDRYENESGEVWYHAVEYERPHERSGAQQADWIDLMRRTLADAGGVPLNRVVLKEKHRQRGLSQHEKVGDQKRTMIVLEGGTSGATGSPLRFEVNLSDYIDTGLFLDHRLTREMVRKEATGRRVLNLFCYTGSFTTYAASGGAASSMSVDLSNTYLEWARRNLGLNNLYSNKHEFVRSDVMEFLSELRTRQQVLGDAHLFDLAIVDPPTFSNSKTTERDWEVGDAHVELFTLLSGLMPIGGVVYFSTNFRKFKMNEEGVLAAGFSVREISRRTVPPEYRNERIHRCWRMVRVDPDVSRPKNGPLPE
jgi:23S rRNA (guanine2445-N2)-methyltransferase / 23S rRNA (guanine2069-N7)-methyltransferase